MGVSPLKKKSAWKLPLPGIEARFCRRLTHKLFAIPALSISKQSDFSTSWSLRKDSCPFFTDHRSWVFSILFLVCQVFSLIPRSECQLSWHGGRKIRDSASRSFSSFTIFLYIIPNYLFVIRYVTQKVSLHEETHYDLRCHESSAETPACGWLD